MVDVSTELSEVVHVLDLLAQKYDLTRQHFHLLIERKFRRFAHGLPVDTKKPGSIAGTGPSVV